MAKMKDAEKNRGISLPRVNLTLSEMLVQGLVRSFLKISNKEADNDRRNIDYVLGPSNSPKFITF